MNLTDGINGSATACYVVWRPRTSGVNQREGLQLTPAPSHFLTGQRSYTDERLGLGIPVGATSRSGGGYGLWPAAAPLQTLPHYRRHLGNPCAEKVRPHRPRQNKPAVRREYPDDVGACQQRHSAGADHKGAASLTKAHGAFRKIGEAVNRQGTLTITGSNVRLGTEMPVALSYF